MAGRLAQVLQQEYKTKGVLSGFASGIGKTTLEKIDLRNAFFSGSGFGSTIGKKIFGKGYSATKKDTSPSTETLNSSFGILSEIRDNSVISTKNSMSLPLIARQINIMQKNVAKLVKLQGGSPSQKADVFFSNAKFRENAYEESLKKGQKTPTPIVSEKKSDNMSILGILGTVGAALLFFGKELGTTAQIIGGVILGLVALKTVLMTIAAAQGIKNLFGLGIPGKGGAGGKVPKGKVPGKFGKMGLILGGIGGALFGSKYLTGTQGTGEEGDEGLTPLGGALEGAAGGIAAAAGIGLAQKFIQPKLETRVEGKAGGKLGYNEKAGRFTKGNQFTKGKDLPLGKILEKMRTWYIKLGQSPGLRSFVFRKLISKFGFGVMLKVSTFLAGLAAAPFTAGLSSLISLASWGLTAYTLYEIYDWLFGEEDNASKLEDAYKLEESAKDAGKTSPEILKKADESHMQGDLWATNYGQQSTDMLGTPLPTQSTPTPTKGAAPAPSSKPTPSGGTSVTSGGQTIGSEEAISYLMQKGSFTREQAAGIVGNLMQESRLNSGAYNPNDKGAEAFGLAQWRKDRLENLKSFAAKQGKNVTDPYTQLDFLMHELGSSEKKANQALRQTKSAEEAALVFGKMYERPQVVEQSRLDYATAAAAGNKLGSSSIAVADAKRTTSSPSGGNIINNTTNNNVAQSGAQGKPASTYDTELAKNLLNFVII